MGSEAFLSGGWLSASAMPPRVPSLFKLVKFDDGGGISAPTDDEVARIEASFMQPELVQQERELLSINSGEEEERQSLLEQMQAYDLMLARVDSSAGGASQINDHRNEVEGALEPEEPVSSGDDSEAARRNAKPNKLSGDEEDNSLAEEDDQKSSQERAHFPTLMSAPVEAQEAGHGCGDFLEDDEDEVDGDILCEFDMMGGQNGGERTGFINADDDIFPPAQPQMASSAWKVKGVPKSHNVIGEGQCLSDSWNPADSSDSSITALRQQYARVFGKETSSNNRQWMLRRLAAIHTPANAASQGIVGGNGGVAQRRSHHANDNGHGRTALRVPSPSSSLGSPTRPHDRDSPMESVIGHGLERDSKGSGTLSTSGIVGHKARQHLNNGNNGAAAAAASLPGQGKRAEGKRQVKPNRQFMMDGEEDGTDNGHHTVSKGHKAGSKHGHNNGPASPMHSKIGSKRGRDSPDIGEFSPRSHKKGRRSPSAEEGVGSAEDEAEEEEEEYEEEEARTPAAKRGHHHHANQQRGGNHKGSAVHKGSHHDQSAANQSGRRSKHHNPWALEEAEALVEGVAQCGGGKWADIKKLGFPAIEHRTAVDLKDKWRNLLRIAMLPQQPAKTAGDKKREMPQELLNRVRELAAKQAKKQGASDGRSGRGAQHSHGGRGPNGKAHME